MFDGVRASRLSNPDSLRSTLFQALLFGKRKRHERRRIAALRRSAAIESLEDRTLLSGHQFLGSCVAAVDELPESQPHAVFAPGTSQEYVNSIDDSPIGLAGGGDEGVSAPFTLASRWSTTATDGSGLGQGDQTTLTWSVVPDGTAIPALGGISGESADPSDFVSFMGGVYGVASNDANYTDEPWFAHFDSVFDRWSELTGINYVYEPNDDGAAFTNFSSAALGVLGTRGDVRIGGHFIDGSSGVLAYNFFPSHGEMIIDTGDNFYSTTTNDSIRLRNVVAHEAGHGIGLRHVESNNAGFLMEPFISTSFDGPQLDDVLGAQRHYGDDFEPNDLSTTATGLGSLAAGQTLTIGGDATDTVVAAGDTSFVSIDGNADSDFFSFTLSAAADVDLVLTPLGPTYNQGPQGGTQSPFNTAAQNDLTLELRDTNGTTVLASANAIPTAPGQSISFPVPAAGTYFARVSGASDAAQLFQLAVSSSTVVPSALTVTIAAGAISESAGNGATTATVSRNSDTTNALTVTISSNDTTEANVQTAVTIPAGQTTSAAFDINAVDDAIVDGTQTVTITATGAGHANGTADLQVLDSEGVLLVDGDSVTPDTDPLVGSSWPRAFQELRTALTAARTRNSDGDVTNDVTAIWIADGTYVPGPARNHSFNMIINVGIYGGFEGISATVTEEALGDRERSLQGKLVHESILSGDLAGNDDPDLTLSQLLSHSTRLDNALRVVFASNATGVTIDGVTITGGTGVTVTETLETRFDGGGILAVGASFGTTSELTLNEVLITGNAAGDSGGGIAGSRALFTIKNSSIVGNIAANGGGIGDAIYNISSLDMSNSLIAGNVATSIGGAISMQVGSTITQSTITDNVAQYGGGFGKTNGSTNLTGDILAHNTIIADNHAPEFPDFAADFTSGSDYNLIGVWEGSSFNWSQRSCGKSGFTAGPGAQRLDSSIRWCHRILPVTWQSGSRCWRQRCGS